MSDFVKLNSLTTNVDLPEVGRYVRKDRVVKILVESKKEYLPDHIEYGPNGRTDTLTQVRYTTTISLAFVDGEELKVGEWTKSGDAYKLKYALKELEASAEVSRAAIIQAIQ